MVELSRDEHPWFVACQFHPEFKSKPLAPHPLFASFVHAAFQNRLQTENVMDQVPETEAAAERAAASEN
jgi:CTP synthase